MVQATTPTFILTLPDTVDISQAANIYFSLRQKNVIIEKSGDDTFTYGDLISIPFRPMR
jgi:hypothetical protein